MEFRVFGQILSSENWAPVPLAMVAIFDIEQPATAQPIATQPLGDSLPNRQAIGTVISDAAGKFELKFTERDFRAGKEARPDLLVAVYAPLTSALDGFSPPPPAERLLHNSTYPWTDAGSQEGLVIVLEASRLRALELLPKVAEQQKPLQDGKSMIEGAATRDALRQHARQAASQIIAPKVREAFARQHKAKTFADSFSPLKQRGGSIDFFLPDTGDKTAHKKLVDEMLERARDAGIERFRSMPPRTTYIDPPRAFTPGEFEIDPSLLPTRVTLENVCDILRQSIGGLSLLRTRSLRDAEERLRRLRGPAADDSSPSPPTPDTPPSPSPSADPAATVSQRLQHLVEQQVADVVMSGPVDPTLERLPLERIRDELAQAELVGGPADTTAYHDFHTVQLAYPDVWAESVSEDLRDTLMLVYRLAERVASDTGMEPDEVLTSEINDLNEFVRTVGVRVGALREASAEAVHPDVTYFFPILETQWVHVPSEKHIFITSKLVEPIAYRRGGDSSSEELFATPRAVIGAAWTAGARAASDVEPDPLYRYRDYVVHEAMQRALEVDAYLSTLDFSVSTGDAATSSTTDGGAAMPRLERLLKELAAMIGREPYSFDYFVEDSYNFGIVTTYRQQWVPGAYQVGDMVSTIPLAPGEKRSIEVRENVKTSRAVKEAEHASRAQAAESTTTARFNEEVTRRAQAATNFTMSSEGSFSIGEIAKIGVSSGFSANQSTFSQSVKQDYREAILKASHEFRNERSLEVATQQERGTESRTTVELSNPNNEVSVTYMLYELERQYRVSEKLHKLQPVILVAQPMPKPNEITEAWLLRHEWIVRRVLLDETLRGALDQLHNSLASDEVAIAVVKANWETQVRVVEKLEGDHSRWVRVRDRLNDSLVKARFAERTAEAAEQAGGLLYDIGSALAAFNPLGAAEAELEAKRKMLEEQMEWANTELQRSAEQLSNGREALNRATLEYKEMLADRTKQRTLIDQLRIHVKDNILYYMQAIWSHEPPDQRYFRLHRVLIIVPQGGGSECTVREAVGDEVGHPIPGLPGRRYVIEDCRITGLTTKMMELHKVADLDRPLGFKGNYILFPLKECTVVTDYMLLEYIDSYFGIRDPDELAEFTTDELTEYRFQLDPDEQTAVDRILLGRLSSNKLQEETIVAPTGQLYMEALVGGHTLLEPFKLAHRGYDAAIAREELRRAGLENLRYASRLLADKPILDDPESDTRIDVEGASHIDVHPPIA